MPKKTKQKVHSTYNKKAFLAPDSIRSMSAIHCKIDETGIAKVTISDCNNSIRIWNDFNNREGKKEMILKIDSLITELKQFQNEVKERLI